LIFTELGAKISHDTPIILFKQGSGSRTINSAIDEEAPDNSFTRSNARAQNVSRSLPLRSAVFSWKNIHYTVTLPDGSHQKLLDDVSGLVAPGKLTALMGESSAGKVRFPVSST